MRRFPTLFILIASMLLGATACGPAVNNDGEVIQIMQQARGDLKAPPNEKPIRTLTVAGSPGLARNSEQPTTEGDAFLGQDGTARVAPEADRLEAESLAQDGRMQIIAGEVEEGVDLLERSMGLHPRTHTLESLASHIEPERVSHYCEMTTPWTSTGEERWKLFDLCRRYQPQAEALEEALPWASPESLEAYRAARP